MEGKRSEIFKVGYILADVTSLNCYPTTFRGGEAVALVHEALSHPFESYKIKVFNKQGVELGCINGSTAMILAPLMGTRKISVECNLSDFQYSLGKTIIIPCQVDIFTWFEFIQDVENAISVGGLCLNFKYDPNCMSLEGGFNFFDWIDKKNKMVVVEPPIEVIKSDLFSHQKEGLCWLFHRENSEDLPPFWVEKNRGFFNLLTKNHTYKRPEPLRGGIFADDMGLGKTLTLLSLIALDKCFSTRKRKFEGVDHSVISSRKVTLVVCPSSVCSTWVKQIEEHVRPGKLKLYLYYGKRTEDVAELQQYDIVLTTYSTLAIEAAKENSAAKKMEWWRVILDEAHTIKNSNAQQSKAVTTLKAKKRWVVTGTPMQNSSLDLFSLMAFLHFEPFSVKKHWESIVQHPLDQRNEEGLLRLQTLMAAVCLRRTKNKGLITLPPKMVETVYVQLSKEEREMYDLLEGGAKSVVQTYINAGRLIQNYSTLLCIVLRLRQTCDDLALCPSDFKAILPSSGIKDVSNNPELLKKLVALLQDGEDLDCPICICSPTDIVITRCAHVFCQSCIVKALQCNRANCPLCRRPLAQFDLFSAPPEFFNAENNGLRKKKNSSKVSTLLSLVVASRDQDPTTKSVVFSQFRKMLVLLEAPLKEAGFNVLRLDGTTNANARGRVIENFEAQNGPTILLASLRASSAGINLTSASHVYLFDPWWNQAVEEQAMDRVHRIGQSKPVKIVRLIVRNSIEERIMQIQEKKKELAMEAFGEKDQREIREDDIRALLSL